MSHIALQAFSKCVLEIVNWFASSATISSVSLDYNLEKSSSVNIALLDLNGLELAELLNETQGSGPQGISLELPGTLASGKYLVRMQTDAGISTQCLIVK